MHGIPKGKIIRDAVHGDIFVEDKFLKIIDTPEFQRMRRIKQLSVANIVFPSADHTRFSHSLGCFYVMKQIIAHFDSIFGKMGIEVSKQDKDIALLAALLHDIGHGPFSHAFEDIHPKGAAQVSHETWTSRIITCHSGTIYKQIEETFGKGTAEKVSELIEKQRRVKSSEENYIIEKIDIGGISLIRAAAKNYNDVIIVASQAQYKPLLDMLMEHGATSSLEERRWMAKEAFAVSSHYDSAIFNYFDAGEGSAFRCSVNSQKQLRYGENPHQKGYFYGNLEAMFDQIHGKEISYNNLLDINAAVDLIDEFEDLTFAILKHNNACGLASRPTVLEAWKDALAGDPVSAFGGVLITNGVIDKAAAEEINKIFFEVIIAPDYDVDALEILGQKKNRIILVRKEAKLPKKQFRALLNGVLVQDKDTNIETVADLKTVTDKTPTPEEVEDMLFANKIVKNSKSNAIVLAKGKQLLASGVGQTSRVDALKQAIEKAKSFGFDLNGAVMASDAFFPFPDCVEIADKEGITAVIQPGGSVKDDLSFAYCNEHGMAMVTTGIRHFKH